MIINFTHNPEHRQDIPVSISYDDDINKAMSVLEDVLNSETHLLQIEGKKPLIKVVSMGDFSVNLIIRLWTKREYFLDVQWDLTKAIKEALDKNGITIPFPTQIEIVKGDIPDDKKVA